MDIVPREMAHSSMYTHGSQVPRCHDGETGTVAPHAHAQYPDDAIPHKLILFEYVESNVSELSTSIKVLLNAKPLTMSCC
jgi:hypothetical protein